MRTLSVVLSLALTAACGGLTSRDAPAEAKPDAGLLDAALVDVSPLPDAAPEEFCEGSSKAEHGGKVAAPTAVTSELVIMNCCDGFTLRFHADEKLGFDVSIMVRYFGGLFEGGSFELPTEGGPLEVSAFESPGQPGPEASVAGTLTVAAPASQDELTFVTACLKVSAPGQLIDGARLHASSVPVAPYAWANRLELRLLQDPNLTAEQAAKMPLESLALKDVGPLFDLMAVASYDGATHTVAWGSWYSSPSVVKQLPAVGVGGLPFVLVANGKRAYLGAFVSSLSSVALAMPVIVVDAMKDESFRIEPSYPPGPAPATDLRNHPEVLGVLEVAGKLVK